MLHCDFFGISNNSEQEQMSWVYVDIENIPMDVFIFQYKSIIYPSLSSQHGEPSKQNEDIKKAHDFPLKYPSCPILLILSVTKYQELIKENN